MKPIVIYILAAFLVAGCAGTSVVMNEKYKGQDLSNKSIVIMPFAEESVIIKNKDDVEDDFEEDKREPEIIIKDFAYQTIIDKAKLSLIGVTLYNKEVKFNCSLSQNDSTKYFSVVKTIGEGEDTVSYKFYVPRKELLKENNINTDIVLVINNLTFGRNMIPGVPHYVPGNTISTPGGTFTTPGHFAGGGSSEFLGANFDFIIYDYNENDVITYGSSGVKKNFLFAMTRSVWEDVFSELPVELFKKTPFKWLFIRRKQK